MQTPLLYSYAHIKDFSEDEQRQLIDDPAFKVLIDSGGFSALNAGYEINLDEYMAWLKKWEKHLHAYVALDKLGDPVQTDINLRKMQDAGLNPIPVHVRGEGEERMDELFEMSDYVAIGGLRRPHRGQATIQYVAERMRWAKGRNVHWLGWACRKAGAKADAIAHLKPRSVDCATWSIGYRFGELELYEGRGRWFPRFSFGESCERRSISRGYRLSPREARVVASAGIPASWLYEEVRWSHSKVRGVHYDNSVMSVLGGHSWVRFADDVRRYWGCDLYLACSGPKARELQPLHWAKCLYRHGRAALECPSILPDEYRAPEVSRLKLASDSEASEECAI